MGKLLDRLRDELILARSPRRWAKPYDIPKEIDAWIQNLKR